MARTERLFQLMQALRRLPSPVTAEQLADDTGVSPRTLYRDIETLRGLGAVIDGAAGFGYTLIEDAQLPPLAFDTEEIEALVLGLREVMAVGDPDLAASAEAALTKLGARLPATQSHRLKHAVLTAHRFDRPPAPTVAARALRTAIWEERQVRFAYRDAKGDSTEREVKPLGIVFFQSSHCLLAYCLLRDGFRAFRLDRMDALEVTQTSFRPHRTSLLREFKQEMESARLRAS